MTTEDKKQELKKYYDNSEFRVFFTDDSEHITQIDFDNETVFYYKYVTASCGCCSVMEDSETDLNHFIEYLSESDYRMLIDELKGALATKH